jgi:transcriptional regulator with XRE-family HTH domain
MSITPNQIKAARALADLSQAELADAIGLSQTAIAQIENSRTQATRRHLDDIRNTLEMRGVEFIENGVRFRPDSLDIIRGDDFGLRMMDYVFDTLKRTGSKVQMLSAVDAKMFDQGHNEKIMEHVRRFQEHGMEQKILVPEGTTKKDLEDWGPVEWHRTLPRNVYSSTTPSFIFGDCYGLMLWEKKEIFIIRNRDLAEDQARKFLFLWERAGIIKD